MNETKASSPAHAAEAAAGPRLTVDERVRLGREIYEQDIRHLVESDHVGKIVAIDVDSGSWALGSSGLDAVKRLRAKHPGAIEVYCEKVGYLAYLSFGAGSLRRTD